MEEDLFPVSSLDSFRVGDFLIRPKLKAVRPFHGFDAPSSAEKDHRLPDKAIAVLLKLAEQPRRVVRREQLLDDVWGQEREAYDRVLDNAISELRRAFGDNARKPRYIQTITKQGYRLIAPVEWPERYGGPDGETSVGPELEDEVVTTAPGLGDPAGSTASAGQTVGNERAEAPGPTVRRGRAGDTPGAGGEPGSDHEAPPGGGAADDDSALTMRLFRPLFIALGVLLAVALAFALERDGKLRVFVAGFENGSGDARFDDIEAQVRGHLAELACPGAPLALRRFGWTTNTSIVGRVEERQGRLVMAATITGPGVSERVEREFTPGLEASRVILAFSDRVQRSLDEQLCTAASPGDAGAACPCLRMVEARLAEGDVSAIEGPLALVLAAEPSVEALEIAIAARDARGEFERARELLATLETLVKTDSEKSRRDRWKARLTGDLAGELAALEALHRAEPQNSRWPLALGQLGFDHGRSCADSEARFNDAQTLGDAVGRLVAQAQMVAFCGNPVRALAGLKEVVKADPGSIAAPVFLARLQRQEGHGDGARKSLGGVLRRQPPPPSALLERAHLHRDRGQLRRADDDYAAFQRSAPWPRGVYDGAMGRAVTALRAGDAERAKSHVGVAEAALGETPEVLWLRGRVAMDGGTPEGAERAAEALEALDAVKVTRRSRAFSLHLRGRLALERGDLQTAVGSFYDAVAERTPETGLFILELAGALDAAGEPERAIDTLSQWLETWPLHAPALCALSAFEARRGRRDHALKLSRRAFEFWSDESGELAMRECKRRKRELEIGSDPR